MANHGKQQRDMMWFAAMREVGHHFSKIGEVISKYAEDSEKLFVNGHAEDFDPKEGSSSPRQTKSRDDDQSRVRGPAWANLGKHNFSRYGYGPERHHGPPPHSYPMYYAPPGEYMPMPMRGNAPYPPDGRTDHENGDPEEHNGMRRKRRASTTAVETGHGSRADDRGDNRAPPRGPRPAKRIRINWSEQENKTFFDTITKNSTLDEGTLLREIVDALGGSRNWIQCKGHFRNLVVVGRIIVREGPPKRWVVLADHEFKRAGSKLIMAKQEKAEEARNNAEQEKKKDGVSDEMQAKERMGEEPDEQEYVDEEEVDGGEDDRADADYNVNEDMELERANDELGDEEVLGAKLDGTNVDVDHAVAPDGSDGLHVAKKLDDQQDIDVRPKDGTGAMTRALRKQQNPNTGPVEDISKVQPFRRGREIAKRRTTTGTLADGRFYARGK